MHILIFFLLYLVRMATEVACFFALLRILQNLRPQSRLVGAFCHAGRPIVDGLLSLLEKNSSFSFLKSLSCAMVCPRPGR